MSELGPGLYLVHKPVGPTSFSAVRAFQEEARARPGKRLRVCHGGTLDPFARGLLVLLAGPATRLMDLLHAAPKAYEAEIAWGAETDTGNPMGRVLSRGDPSALSPQVLEAALSRFVGWRDQVPPPTSAKKIEGEPAYRRVERGEQVELPPSRVYLHEAHFLSHSLPERSRIALTCRGGFYVRALARDLGRALGCGAHLASLDRTAIGPWRDPGPGGRVAVRGEEIFPWYPARPLSDAEVGELRKGGAIPRGEVREPGWKFPGGFPSPPPRIRAFHLGHLVALLEERDGVLRTAVDLRPGL